MSRADLARHTGLSEKHIGQLINGEAPISAETAVRLERATDIPARLWTNMEQVYRSHFGPFGRIRETGFLKPDYSPPSRYVSG